MTFESIPVDALSAASGGCKKMCAPPPPPPEPAAPAAPLIAPQVPGPKVETKVEISYR